MSWILEAQQRTIEGKVISDDERWTGVVVITGDVKVAKGGRLVIDPGTRVLFQPEMDNTSGGKDKTRGEIIVEGTLIARGSINNKIIFTSNSSTPRMGDWYGVSVSGRKQISILDYVTVEYAFDGLRIKKSSPQVNNSQFRYNYNSGILADMKASPKIIGNIISENGYAGLICKLGAKPVLSENMITGNQIGLLVDGSSQPNLGNLQEGADYNIGKNRLFDNLEYNVYNHGSKDIYAANNYWGSESSGDISATIFDSNNDRKYGSVGFTPVLGSSDTDLNSFISVAQETAILNAPPSQSLAATVQPVANNESNPLQNNAQAASGDQVDLSQNLVSSDESSEEPAFKHRTIDQMLGTLAVAESQPEEAAPPPEAEKKKPEIDYDQVFLDAFLDNGKKISKTVSPVIGNNRVWTVQGRVIVRVVVAKDGKVESAQVLKGLNDYIDNTAIKAARNFEFEPATVHGKSARFSTNIIFKF